MTDNDINKFQEILDSGEAISLSGQEYILSELKKYKEVVEFVKLWDPYPDLSSFKYYDAFKAIRNKIMEVLGEVN